jgi:hypothetical protein
MAAALASIFLFDVNGVVAATVRHMLWFVRARLYAATGHFPDRNA